MILFACDESGLDESDSYEGCKKWKIIDIEMFLKRELTGSWIRLAHKANRRVMVEVKAWPEEQGNLQCC